MIFLELIKVFEFTFELSRHKQVLRFLVNSEHVVVLILEVFELDLVQAKRGQATQGRVSKLVA